MPPLAIVTWRPSMSWRSTSRVGATTSTRFWSSASCAVYERLSTTAASASFTLRPWRAASERIVRRRVLLDLLAHVAGMSSPWPATGCAAPV